METLIEVRNIKKAFGDNEVLKNIDFQVHRGEVIVVIGPSGSGKSTLLRCMNLLEEPDGGSILFKGDNVLDGSHDLNAFRRNFGMVFQQFNLFQSYTVLDNCTLGQEKVLGTKKRRRKSDCDEESRLCRHDALYSCKTEAAVGRDAAAGGDRQSALHGAGSSFV